MTGSTRVPVAAALLIATMAATTSLGVGGDARAFCGFYVSGAQGPLVNKATMVVLMRDGTRTVLAMQNNYQGPPENFAMVVPVPVVLQQANVKTLPRAVFERVDSLAAPRLVEVWEQDPCQFANVRARRGYGRGVGTLATRGSGAGGSGADLGVRIEAQFVVGEYQILILSAEDSTGLETWLHREHYNIPQGASASLAPYVQAGMKFFVARVDASRVRFENGQAMLSPLRFHYDSETFSLPVRLGLLNSSGTQDLIVHILARGKRFEVANYRNTFIPTNVNVVNAVRHQFPAFYAALFDKTMERNPGAVVTEYSWQATSCDPCPTQPLTAPELTVLGADALPNRTEGTGTGNYHAYNAGWNEFTLTRLHYRYGPTGLRDDLVFREAPAVVGGRETEYGMYGQSRPERGVHRIDGANQFQGRYVIRHWWRGAVACARPVRGVWGEPPDGSTPASTSARNSAFAPRGGVRLERLVTQPIPALGIVPRASGTAAPTPAPAPGAAP